MNAISVVNDAVSQLVHGVNGRVPNAETIQQDHDHATRMSRVAASSATGKPQLDASIAPVPSPLDERQQRSGALLSVREVDQRYQTAKKSEPIVCHPSSGRSDRRSRTVGAAPFWAATTLPRTGAARAPRHSTPSRHRIHNDAKLPPAGNVVNDTDSRFPAHPNSVVRRTSYTTRTPTKR